MEIPIEVLEAQVLQLPTADRVRLLDRVVASLDADAARDAAWDAVAARREAESDRDPSLFVPLDEALDRLRVDLR